MKKKVVASLAAAMILGVAGTSFAASNPFVDVPANNWAYGAVSKLAQAGIIDGYGDGTFKGDKTITRYEMAQIVAKALANEDKADAVQKAQIQKLEAEYADELDKLGVRVGKLEKKMSNIRLSADARLRYDSNKNAIDNVTAAQAFPNTAHDPAAAFKDRFRLNMNADINSNSSVYARFVFTDGAFQGDKNRLSDLAFTTKKLLLNTDVTLGRYTLNLGPTTFFAGTTGNVEGIKTYTKSGKANLMLGYADFSWYEGYSSNSANVLNTDRIKNAGFAELNYAPTNKLSLNADYFKNKAGIVTDGVIANAATNTFNSGDVYNIFGGGLTYAVTPTVKLIGEYYTNTADRAKAENPADPNSAPKATIIRLAYKGANQNNPGSWGAFFEATRFDHQALPYGLVGPYTKVGDYTADGLKSKDININYTLAKNVTFEGVYQFDMKGSNGEKLAQSGDTFTRAQVNYFF
jgi:hypothetical protein